MTQRASRFLRSLALPVLLLAGCGNAGMASTGSGTTSSGAGGGAGVGGGACTGSIDLAVDNGAPEHLTYLCRASWNPSHSMEPIGYSYSGGPGLGAQMLVIEGCLGADSSSEGLELRMVSAMSPGNYTMGVPKYVDTMDVEWGDPQGSLQVTITKLGAVGDSIEGTFSATAVHAGKYKHALSGSFHVCRGPDTSM